MMEYSLDFVRIKIIFILINVVNLLIMWNIGCQLRYCRTNEAYWRKAAWIILSYSVMMGLRFGRMVDYNVYFDRYIEAGTHFSLTGYELFFKCFCWCLYNVGFSYQSFIWICSLILIIAVLYMIKDYKEAAPYICLLFLWEAHNAELLIRWYLAFAFYIVAIVHMKHHSFKYAAVFYLIAIASHIGMIVLTVLSLIIFIIKKQILPSLIVAVLFLVSMFVGSIGMLDFLKPYVSLFAVDSISSHYTNNFEEIISGEYGYVGFLDERTSLNIVRRLLAYLLPIIFMSSLLKKKLLSPFEVNMFSLGVILSPILLQVEVLNRYGEGLMFFSIIISAISYSYIFKNKKAVSKLLYYASCISFLCNVWPVLSAIINRDKWWHMLYVWDADGRDVLPLSLFINF